MTLFPVRILELLHTRIQSFRSKRGVALLLELYASGFDEIWGVITWYGKPKNSFSVAVCGDQEPLPLAAVAPLPTPTGHALSSVESRTSPVVQPLCHHRRPTTQFRGGCLELFCRCPVRARWHSPQLSGGSSAAGRAPTTTRARPAAVIPAPSDAWHHVGPAHLAIRRELQHPGKAATLLRVVSTRCRSKALEGSSRARPSLPPVSGALLLHWPTATPQWQWCLQAELPQLPRSLVRPYQHTTGQRTLRIQPRRVHRRACRSS